MRKVLLLAALAIVSFSVFPQQITEETVVINVEVPSRVFSGNTFVDNLTINDFEVYENGILQKIEAVYLVKKRSIERREEKKRFSPKTSRDFHLFFEVSEYTPKLGQAVSYFIHNVMAPDDNLTIVTPMKTYRLRAKTFEILSKEDVVNQLKGILRKDALVGSSEYRDTISDITNLARSLTTSIQRGSGAVDGTASSSTDQELEMLKGNLDQFTPTHYDSLPLDDQLLRYADLLGKLEHLRNVDQKGFLEFAELLRDKEGQKYVFIFYQREFIPQIETRILNTYKSMFQDRPDIIHSITGLFEFYRRDSTIDVDRIKQAYADSSISIHFLFITIPRPHIPGVEMVEHSEDIFGPFIEMAVATGGYTDSAANSASLFQKAMEASENYYLLYYSPQNYKSDGKFKNIKVRVKDKSYRIVHRVGYFAN